MELKQPFLNNMKKLLGKDYQNYIDSFSCASKRGLRVNKNYLDYPKFEDIFEFPVKKIEKFEGIYILGSEQKIGNSVYHHAGMIYLQEPSSMLAVMALDVKSQDKVLDLCAAPGGKTSQILEKVDGELVISNEIVYNRANILISNIERQGFKNSIVTCLDAESLAQEFPNYFDKILVDAPCSGEGMFRRDPQTIDEWNEGLLEFNHQRQLEILNQADLMLKQNGYLLYSTCTFNKQENEQTVIKFCLEKGYRICSLDKKIKAVTRRGFKNNDFDDLAKTARCFPQDGFGEGQFIALLQKFSLNLKEENRRKKSIFSELSRNEKQLAKEFLKQTINRDDLYLYKLNNNLYVSEIEVPKISKGVLSLGVKLGQVEKNRLVPHHQFFKAYGKSFLNQVELSKEDSYKYLYGLELENKTNIKGYALVLFEGVPLGGVKASNNTLKNHYPKGLRNLKLEI